ncbi:MAG: DUF6514 family protein [Hydrogenoanaerobacterium sp.]
MRIGGIFLKMKQDVKRGCGSFILTEKRREVEDSGEVTLFGIELSEEGGPKIALDDISSHRDVAQRFLELCERNNVSAQHIKDVAEDFLE